MDGSGFKGSGMMTVDGRTGRPRVFFWITVEAILPLLALRGHAHPSTPISPTSHQASATVATYCAPCHSARIHTAGLVLDQDAIDQIPANAERWEKVIRKLEARS